MKGISIIVTAYHTKQYIKDALDSISNQEYFKTHHDYEILVGIDGDLELAQYMSTIKDEYHNLHVLVSHKNVGTYVMTNSLMSMASYDTLLRFDSDDVMMPNMVSVVMEFISKFDYIRPSHIDYDDTMTTPTGKIKKTWGPIAINRCVFEETGGYRPWVCGADTDFLNRIKTKYRGAFTKSALFKRRIHSASLTQNPNTGLHSAIRAEYKKFIKEETSKPENFKIETVTCPLDEI